MKVGKRNITIIIVLIVLIIIAVPAIWLVNNIKYIMSKLNFKEIDNENLSINENLYSKVDNMTEQEFNNVKKVVFFGIDTQSSGDGQEVEGFLGRSDSIIIASINPKYKSIKFISIPRDTYAEIEGHGKMKINYAFEIGEEELAIKTINQNFDLDLTEYATVDFEGLANIINDIGGIEVDITKSEKNWINVHAKEIYAITGREEKKLSSYGTVTLDGEQAITHSRNRSIGNDFTRAQRQRYVLEAIFAKMSTMELADIYDILTDFLEQVTTNINITDYIGTITEILWNKNEYSNNIISVQVPDESYAKSQYIDDIYYFVPTDVEKMKQKMIDYLYNM